MFKVSPSTWCHLHFPSLIHSIYLHLQPFPWFSLHQKAWNPTRIQAPSNRAKPSFSSYQGSKLARSGRAHKHDRANLCRIHLLSFSPLDVKLAWVLFSLELYIKTFHLSTEGIRLGAVGNYSSDSHVAYLNPTTHFPEQLSWTLTHGKWGLRDFLSPTEFTSLLMVIPHPKSPIFVLKFFLKVAKLLNCVVEYMNLVPDLPRSANNFPTLFKQVEHKRYAEPSPCIRLHFYDIIFPKLFLYLLIDNSMCYLWWFARHIPIML